MGFGHIEGFFGSQFCPLLFSSAEEQESDDETGKQGQTADNPYMIAPMLAMVVW